MIKSAKKKSRKKNKPGDEVSKLKASAIRSEKQRKKAKQKDDRKSMYKEAAKSQSLMNKAKKILKIEKYAKDNQVTIAQSMIHFM